MQAHSETIERLEQLEAILSDPTVPDGASIRLAKSGRYSLVEQAMHDHEGITGLPLTRSSLRGSRIDGVATMASVKQSKRPVRRRRAPPLTQARIDGVVALIGEWAGGLTWDSLCEAVERETGSRYTRQALNNYVEIKAAYTAYRQQPTPHTSDKKLSRTQQKILNLERKVAELEAVRDALLDKFARWSVNASSRSLDHDFLDQPLRPISRSQNR